MEETNQNYELPNGTIEGNDDLIREQLKDFREVELRFQIPDTPMESHLHVVYNINESQKLFDTVEEMKYALSRELRIMGLITRQGVSEAELPDVRHEMEEYYAEMDAKVNNLQLMRREIEESELVYKQDMLDMINQQIQDGMLWIGKYIELFVNEPEPEPSLTEQPPVVEEGENTNE